MESDCWFHVAKIILEARMTGHVVVVEREGAGGGGGGVDY